MTPRRGAYIHDALSRAAARLARSWRQARVGICFVVYALAAWLGGVTVLPLLLLWPGSRDARQRRIRGLVSWSFRWLFHLVAVLRVGDIRVEGRHWLEHAHGKLIVANHPMYVDAGALMSLLPQATCVIKGTFWRSRWYQRFMRTTGYISNAADTALVSEGVAALERDQPLIVFPEGTRSTPGAPLRFTRGAARVAVRSGVSVIPVVIDCQPLELGKNQRWYHVAARAWRLRLRVHPPQSLSAWGWREELPEGAAARRVNKAMEAFFARELAAGDAPASAEGVS